MKMKKMKEKKRQIQVCAAFFLKQRTDVKTAFGLCSLQLNADPFVALNLGKKANCLRFL